eukprot:CAMPEP_0197727516 /NCGR_PEP_ID=MMETSP1434-20131217/20910_1 /TAXON_ID=265543 /ORGANISM="Minutocellus polymorphus, Strain CCMP3303" /LENGTH=80 /DNA_ID=CAMNT_0043313737 /DNA_START=79 /DNA_END=318 /DNA_ORIENTATION=+
MPPRSLISSAASLPISFETPMNLLPMFFTPPTTLRNLAAGRARALPIAADTPLLLFSSLHWLIPLKACSRSAPDEHAAAA